MISPLPRTDGMPRCRRTRVPRQVGQHGDAGPGDQPRPAARPSNPSVMLTPIGTPHDDDAPQNRNHGAERHGDVSNGRMTVPASDRVWLAN